MLHKATHDEFCLEIIQAMARLDSKQIGFTHGQPGFTHGEFEFL